MKQLIGWVLSAVILTAAGTATAQTDVYVNGYTRSDGRYVKPYHQTAPDGIPYNNCGYPGNYNPNTGKITGGNPDTYLRNHGWGSGSYGSPYDTRRR